VLLELCVLWQLAVQNSPRFAGITDFRQKNLSHSEHVETWNLSSLVRSCHKSAYLHRRQPGLLDDVQEQLIGITAMSHKVIRHLLDEVVRAAQECGIGNVT
jgi:hypothetical protein